MSEIRSSKILVPTAALGTGIRADNLDIGLAMGADAIACDAGSTDSGPAYLSTGTAKYSRDAIKADLDILVRAQARSGVPLLIGSCGTSGCDAALDGTFDILLEILQGIGHRPRIALLYSEQDRALMADYARRGLVTPLAPMSGVDADQFTECNHVVALMGPEPYIDALRGGADIILGGRTTDTAVLAAVALMRGAGKGPSWHAGKIGECGALCTIDPRNGGVMLTIDTESFVVEPLSPDNRCTTYSVSSHMLYENSDPFLLTEPGGVLDVREARYEQLDERRVKVTGSNFIEKPYTMKLEGAGSTSFQTIMLVGIRDRKVLAEIDRFITVMHETLTRRVSETIGQKAGDYDISLRAYGWNGVTGTPPDETLSALPLEIGLLFIATAETQEMANLIAKTCNPWFFHLPIDREIELPSYAFPFSPAEIDKGPVHAFLLNHVVSVSDAAELVRTKFIDLKDPEYANSK